jgi:hypothetical protein
MLYQLQTTTFTTLFTERKLRILTLTLLTYIALC